MRSPSSARAQNTARYAGMNVGWVIMRTMFLSGAIAGRGGLPRWSPAPTTPCTDGVAAGVGFTAITVAWLSPAEPLRHGRHLRPAGHPPEGCGRPSTPRCGVPTRPSADVITGVLLFFMLGCEFFINYKLVFRGAEERRQEEGGGEMTFLLNLITAAVTLRHAPALRHQRRNPHREVGQPEPGRRGHDVHGRRPGPGRGVLL